jgi:Protein of unknown function (DUF3017)
MANRPANAGPGGVGVGGVGLGSGQAPTGDAAPRARSSPGVQASRSAAGHRATRRKTPNQFADRADAAVGVLAWVPYLIVLAGAGLGMFLAVGGAKHAVLGTALLGGSMLIAAVARLLLPERYAGLLASRRKASDVLAFATLGAAVLTVALTLP